MGQYTLNIYNTVSNFIVYLGDSANNFQALLDAAVLCSLQIDAMHYLMKSNIYWMSPNILCLSIQILNYFRLLSLSSPWTFLVHYIKLKWRHIHISLNLKFYSIFVLRKLNLIPILFFSSFFCTYKFLSIYYIAPWASFVSTHKKLFSYSSIYHSLLFFTRITIPTHCILVALKFKALKLQFTRLQICGTCLRVKYLPCTFVLSLY